LLSDREKLILHFVAMIPDIVELEYMEKDQAKTKKKMMYDVIHSRCRSIAPEDVEDILAEINEEMLAGKILYEQLAGDLKWSMTGERPNKNTNWKDMR
jgi:hypothetical protein